MGDETARTIAQTFHRAKKSPGWHKGDPEIGEIYRVDSRGWTWTVRRHSPGHWKLYLFGKRGGFRFQSAELYFTRKAVKDRVINSMKVMGVFR